MPTTFDLAADLITDVLRKRGTQSTPRSTIDKELRGKLPPAQISETLGRMHNLGWVRRINPPRSLAWSLPALNLNPQP
jgi:hypothetical protein